MVATRQLIAGIWLAALLAGSALAQSGQPVRQSGNVTNGHLGVWQGPGLLQDGGGLAINTPLAGASTTSVASNSTVYCSPSGCNASSSIAALSSVSGSMTNLNFSVGAAPTGANTVTATLYVGSYGALIATSVTCTITGAATSCSDASHAAVVNAGQAWAVQVVTSASATSTAGQAFSTQLSAVYPPPLPAQTVRQSGNITNGHVVTWVAPGVVADTGFLPSPIGPLGPGGIFCNPSTSPAIPVSCPGLIWRGVATMTPRPNQTTSANDCWVLLDPFSNPIACNNSTTSQGLQEFMNATAANGWPAVVYGPGISFPSHTQSVFIESTNTVQVPVSQDWSFHAYGVALNCNMATVSCLQFDSQGASVFDWDDRIIYNPTAPNGNTTTNPSCSVFFNPTTATADGIVGIYAGLIRIKNPVAQPQGGTRNTAVLCFNTNSGSGIEGRYDFGEINASGATDGAFYGMLIYGAGSQTGFQQNQVTIQQIHGFHQYGLEIGFSTSVNNPHYNSNLWNIGNIEGSNTSTRGIDTWGSSDIFDIGIINAQQGGLAIGIATNSDANSTSAYNKFRYGSITGYSTLDWTDGSGLCNSFSGGNGISSGSSGSQIGLPGANTGCTLLKPSAAASGTITVPAATDTLVARATTDTLTNKTYDTAGTGNVFKINGTQITAISGNTGTVGTTSGALTNNHCVKIDANGNLVDNGSTCGGAAINLVVGTTTITSGTTTRILYDNAGVLGEYTLTGTGTTAVMATSPTIATPTITTSAVIPLIGPASDSTTAIKITKADLATAIVTVDTTNKRVGINVAPGAFDLNVNGAANFGSTLAVTGHVTLEGVTSTGATGTGNLVFATAPTFTTSITDPLIIGGSGTTGTQLTLQTTTGVGTTDQFAFNGGNNGATTFALLSSTVLTLNGNIKLPNAGAIFPATDSTTALKIQNAAASSTIVDVDTTNKRVGINKTPGAFDLDVNGAVNFGSTAVVATSITDPVVIGGTLAASTLELRATSGVGAGGAIKFTVGNNGASQAITIRDSNATCGFDGCVVIGTGSTNPSYLAMIAAPAGQHALLQFANSTTGYGASSGAYFGILNGEHNFRINLLDASGAIWFSNTVGIGLALNPNGGISLGNGPDWGVGNLSIAGAYGCKSPTTQTGATYSQAVTDCSVIANASGTLTLTLLSPSTYPGRILYVKTIASQTVVSASSNVVPVTSNTAGTAILAGTAGKWAILQSDGSNWITMAAN